MAVDDLTREIEMERRYELLKILDTMSVPEIYMMTLDCFGESYGYLGGPLMVPPNDKSEKVFHSLLLKGLCYLDNERGQIGYRATPLAFELRSELYQSGID